MTVGELIKQLKQHDLNLPVFANYMDIEIVRLNPEHFFGDSADPNCVVGEAVEIE